jgi:hypothetical protein
VEAQRLTRLLEDEQKDLSAWKLFVQRVGELFPGCGLWDKTLLWLEPSYRLRVALPGTARSGNPQDELVCLLSVLAPVYAIYASHVLKTESLAEAWTRYPPLPAQFQPHEAKLAQLIESTFGAARLPNEVLFTPVADLDPRTGNVGLGKALLVDLLLTADRW